MPSSHCFCHAVCAVSPRPHPHTCCVCCTTAAYPADTSGSGVCRSNPLDEYDALSAWSASEGGPGIPSWTLTTFAGGCPSPAWAGVGCDAATGRVTSLNLTSTPLACSASCLLPPNLLPGLSALKALSLAGTSLGRPLAALDVSMLWQLEALDLSNAPNLAGPLPAEWPQHLPSLRSLRVTGLAVNTTGAIPVEWVTAESWASTLQSLDVGGLGAALAVPSDWALAALTQLNVSGNAVSGNLGSLLAGSPALQRLDVSSTGLSTNLSSLAWAPAAQSLRELRLSNNPGVGGMLPPALLEHVPLVVLEAANCSLSGALPPVLVFSGAAANNATLQHVDLSGNRLGGPLPPSWANLTSLRELLLSDNVFAVRRGLQCFGGHGAWLLLEQPPNPMRACAGSLPIPLPPHVIAWLPAGHAAWSVGRRTERGPTHAALAL